MSDYLPLEIQREIIQRLPVRSLIQFRSVSKAWKSLIDSPQFIAAYSVSHTHPHHLLISYEHILVVDGQYVHRFVDEHNYVSIVDDDTFPQRKFAPTVPLSIKLLLHSRVVGSSGGLLCFYGCYLRTAIKCQTVVLWNPSIRKSVAFDVPSVNYWSYEIVFGFGVCPVTNDPKIVKITHDWLETESKNKVPWKVEVYTLASGEWRTPSRNLPSQSIQVTWEQVVIDKFIYWLAFENIVIDDEVQTTYTIMSFDMTTDEFREVYLPDSLAHRTYIEESIFVDAITISKVQGSLVVLKHNMDADKVNCVVWMMEYGVPKLCTKLFTIKTPHASIRTLGFTRSGKPIMKTLDDLVDEDAEATLVVYEPYSKHINDLGVSGSCSFSVNSYMETLLLLNQ